MKYSNAILPIIILGIFIISLLFYFAKITKVIEKENYKLKIEISKIHEQININEIEFSLYNSYDYLTKIQKIYFTNSENESFDNRTSFNDFKNKELNYFYNTGMQ